MLLVLSGGNEIYVFQDGAYRLVSRSTGKDTSEGFDALVRLSRERRFPSVPELDPESVVYIGDSSAPAGIDHAMAGRVGIVINVGDAMLEMPGQSIINLHRGYLRTIDLIITASAALKESGRAKVPESPPDVGDTVLWTFERKHFPPDRRLRVRVGASGYVHAGVASRGRDLGPGLQRAAHAPAGRRLRGRSSLRSRSVHVLLDGGAVDPRSSGTLGERVNRGQSIQGGSCARGGDSMTDGADAPIDHEPTASKVDSQRAFGLRRQFRTLCTLRRREIVSLLVTTYSDWSSDGAPRLGAAFAYFTLFSVAPVLIIVTGVVGLFIGQAAASGQVAPWLERFLSPRGAEAAQLMLKQAATPAGGIVTTVGGVLTLFLGTSALVNELRHSLNVVWRVQEPPSEGTGMVASIRAMVSDRLYAFLIVAGAGLLVLASLVVNTTVTAAATYFHGWLPIPATVLQIINLVASVAVMTVVFTLVYKTVPDAHVAWGDATIGALVTALLFSTGDDGPLDFPGNDRWRIPIRHRRQRAGAAAVGVLLRPGVLLWR